MPDYVDVTRLIVRANRVPTLSVPSIVNLYEGQNTIFDVQINTGYPAATSLTYQLRNASNQNVNEGGSNPDITVIDDFAGPPPLPANSYASLTHRVTAPTLPGNSPNYVDWLLEFTLTSTEGTARGTVRIRVNQSVAATISVQENLSAYEMMDVSIPITYLQGSPGATAIRHSFHNSLSNARSGSNPVSNRPSVTIDPNAAALAAIAPPAGNIRERTGSLAYTLPAVSSDTTWYGRVEIVQNGSVVDSDTYTLTIRNAVAPSISISSGFGIEGTRAVTNVYYVSGAPFATSFSIVGFYNSQSDAQSNRNRLTSADGIPSNIEWSPATPSQLTGNLNGFLRFTLPYVTADKRIWGLARISRDNGGGSVSHWQTTFYIDILNRVPATIDVQEVTTMDEEDTMTITGEYTRGVPAARGFGVSIHDTEADANANRNPVMDDSDPRITLSAYDNTGSYTATKQFTITINTPDISADRSWWPRYYMDQDTITPDP